MRDIDEISGDVVDVALRLHRDLGPGLLESVYEAVLAARLSQLGYAVARQQPVDINFDGVRLEGAFKIDLLVDRRLIIEIKSCEKLMPVHAKQLLTYLRLMNQPLGLLMNFGADMFRNGLKRVINNRSDYLAPPKS